MQMNKCKRDKNCISCGKLFHSPQCLEKNNNWVSKAHFIKFCERYLANPLMYCVKELIA